MPMYRVHVQRAVYLVAEIEAEDADEAREMAHEGGHDWTDDTGGRGLGDDDLKVLDVEDIEDEYESDESE